MSQPVQKATESWCQVKLNWRLRQSTKKAPNFDVAQPEKETAEVASVTISYFVFRAL
jgi:hypothetical protein